MNKTIRMDNKKIAYYRIRRHAGRNAGATCYGADGRMIGGTNGTPTVGVEVWPARSIITALRDNMQAVTLEGVTYVYGGESNLNPALAAEGAASVAPKSWRRGR